MENSPSEPRGRLAAPLVGAQLLEVLPHRPPFIFVDAITELDPGRRAVGIKNVSFGEPYLSGHFPDRPIMPGVLIVEALAQVGAVAVLSTPEARGRLALFRGIDRMRFRRQVVPGDQLRLEVEIVRRMGSVGRGRARAAVGPETAAEGALVFALVE